VSTGTDAAKTEYQAAQKTAANATFSQLLQLATFAGMTFAWAALRGRTKDYEDKDGEMIPESVLKKIGKDMIGSAFSGVPGGSEAWELVSSLVFGDKYYGFDNVTASSIDDVANAFLKAGNQVKSIVDSLESGDDIDWNSQRLKLDSVISAVSKMLGVPYDNVKNIFNLTFMHAAKAVSGDFEGQYAYLRLTEDPGSTASVGDYYDLLYRASKAGGEEYQHIYDEMIESGYFTPEKIKTNMEKRMKEEQDVEHVSDLPTRYMTPEEENLYSEAWARLSKTSLYKQASSDQRAAAELELSKNADLLGSELTSIGITDGEYALYTLALAMVDEPNASGNLGTYTKKEKQAALKKAGLPESLYSDLQGLGKEE